MPRKKQDTEETVEQEAPAPDVAPMNMHYAPDTSEWTPQGEVNPAPAEAPEVEKHEPQPGVIPPATK